VTGLPVSTYFSAYKFQWMRQHVPEVRQLQGPAAAEHAGAAAEQQQQLRQRV
jgi:glycerol kinase